jgi:phosphoglycerate dehydrogenase-like enzyme
MAESSNRSELRIYAENVGGRSAYGVDEAGIRGALGDLDILVSVTVRSQDDPDLDALARAEIFIGSGFDPQRLAMHGAALKIVHSTSAGVERYMPLTWLPNKAVLTNSSGAHAEKAGEFGLLALMMLNDKIPQHVTHQRQHAWRPSLSSPIRGKTVLIYGVGALGGAIAEKAKLLGLKVMGIRRSGEKHFAVDKMFVPPNLDALLPEVDFIVVTCPLTPETRKAFGREQIARLAPHAGLVNISRAAVVDYKALAEALTEGRLAGAVLDVFEEEPLPAEAPWWDVPNLVVIPHVSSDSGEGYVQRSLAICAMNIRNYLSGRELTNVVSPDLCY